MIDACVIMRFESVQNVSKHEQTKFWKQSSIFRRDEAGHRSWCRSALNQSTWCPKATLALWVPPQRWRFGIWIPLDLWKISKGSNLDTYKTQNQSLFSTWFPLNASNRGCNMVPTPSCYLCPLVAQDPLSHAEPPDSKATQGGQLQGSSRELAKLQRSKPTMVMSHEEIWKQIPEKKWKNGGFQGVYVCMLFVCF